MCAGVLSIVPTDDMPPLLHTAAIRSGNEAIISILCSVVPVNTQDTSGDTALMWASLKGHTCNDDDVYCHE